ncbi:MAG: DUF6132 family protein [Bacteroidales bacterium]
MSETHEQGAAEAPEKKKKKFTDYIGIGAIVGIILGALGGYLYYYYIGCRSGSCPINSNPYFSTLWGAVIGYLLGDIFKKRKTG